MAEADLIEKGGRNSDLTGAAERTEMRPANNWFEQSRQGVWNGKYHFLYCQKQLYNFCWMKGWEGGMRETTGYGTRVTAAGGQTRDLTLENLGQFTADQMVCGYPLSTPGIPNLFPQILYFS